jgi:hypothetical protein
MPWAWQVKMAMRDDEEVDVRTVVLEKVEAGEGVVPVGVIYKWTFMQTSIEEARKRARKALQRDHPREDLANWRVVES